MYSCMQPRHYAMPASQGVFSVSTLSYECRVAGVVRCEVSADRLKNLVACAEQKSQLCASDDSIQRACW